MMKLTLCLNRLTMLLVCLVVLASEAQAELRLPHIFGDSMVLQREKPVAVWGWADAGKQVTVEFAGQRKDCLAGQDGRWRHDTRSAARLCSGSGTRHSFDGKFGRVRECLGR